MGRGLKNQMKEAHHRNAKLAVIIGADELRQSQVTLKDMKKRRTEDASCQVCRRYCQKAIGGQFLELKIHPSLIEQVVDIAESTDFWSWEVQYRDYRVYVKRACNEVSEARAEVVPAPRPLLQKRPDTGNEQPDEHTVVVRSPLSGIFYRAPTQVLLPLWRRVTL